MKRMLALALCAVLLVGALAACGGGDDPEITENKYTGEATPMMVNIPAGWIAFGSIDDENVVTVHGLNYLRSAAGETVVVDDRSAVTANVTGLDDSGDISSVTVDGRSISVLIDKTGAVRILYAEQGDPAEDPGTIDLTTVGNLETAAGVSTTRPAAGAVTTKPLTTVKPLSTAAAIKTTVKPKTTEDLYAQEKKDIMNSDMTNKEKQEALKLLSYMMDENGIFYVEHEPWQKQFGFNQIYDLASPLIQLVYATIRVKFRYGYVYKLDAAGKVLYDDNNDPVYETDSKGKPIPKDWMIQLWKGRYGLVMLGAEFGVYTKPSTQQSEHYNAAVAEEELVMAMDVYQHNFRTGKTTYLFTRGPESNWWLTGFVPGSYIEHNKKEEVIAVGNIQFPSEEMMQLFASGLKAAGFSEGAPGRDNPETYRIAGASIKFSWQYVDQDKT